MAVLERFDLLGRVQADTVITGDKELCYILLPKLHGDIARKNWSVNEQVITAYVQANIDAASRHEGTSVLGLRDMSPNQ